MKATVVAVVSLVAAFTWTAPAQGRMWTVADQCNADGPGFIADYEVLPWLTKVLDEMEQLTTALLDKINEGVAFLEPHVDRSPMADLKREEYFSGVKESVSAYYREVYDETITAWRNLSRLNENIESSLSLAKDDYHCVFAMGSIDGFHPYQDIFADLSLAIRRIQENHKKTANILRFVLRDLSITTQSIVTNSVAMITETLKLDGVDKEDGQRLMASNLARMAPNFLGLVLRKLMQKGSDPKNYKKIHDDVLRELMDSHIMLQNNVLELGFKCYPCYLMNTLFRNLWRSQSNGAAARIRGSPALRPDESNAYENEEFLSEVTLALMASYQEKKTES